ncbi:hypothetical protein ACQPW1_00360 [Nocardia sp. CA-128927]|uniref:hypothetical protein n=1 Tax=Nocardia sp. CA-128927 TaxID=3239975 RepID=UPI003D95CE1D
MDETRVLSMLDTVAEATSEPPARRPRRNRRSAKAAGTRHESATAEYLAEHVDDRIERRAKNGRRDRGDLSSVRAPGGGRLVGECKDYGGRLLPGQWLAEAEIERGNDDALASFVVAKRRGVADPGAQFVLMTVRDLAAILTGVRPEEV